MVACWGPEFPAGHRARLVALALSDGVHAGEPIPLTESLRAHLGRKVGMDRREVERALVELVRAGVLRDHVSYLTWELDA